MLSQILNNSLSPPPPVGGAIWRKYGLIFIKSEGYKTTDVITSITSTNANGQSNAVTYSEEKTVVRTSWNVYRTIKADLATISLAEGTNTITFTFGDKNVNISGVFLKADNEVVFGKNEND